MLNPAGNPEDRFSPDTAHIISNYTECSVTDVDLWSLRYFLKKNNSYDLLSRFFAEMWQNIDANRFILLQMSHVMRKPVFQVTDHL